MASLVAPHYPALHLVRSKVMEEAERRTEMPFLHVAGKVVDESDIDNIVKEGWSEIAGSLKDDSNMVRITPAAEEDGKIEIHDDSSQTIYVPACPKFWRTDSDDTQISPLLHFIKSRAGSLLFPRHMVRCQQALTRPSFFSFSPLLSQLHMPSGLGTFLQRSWQFVSTYTCRALHIHTLNLYEILLIAFIIGAEFSTTLLLSNFSIQQSTPAQVTWVVMWLITIDHWLYIWCFHLFSGPHRFQNAEKSVTYVIEVRDLLLYGHLLYTCDWGIRCGCSNAESIRNLSPI